LSTTQTPILAQTPGVELKLSCLSYTVKSKQPKHPKKGVV